MSRFTILVLETVFLTELKLIKYVECVELAKTDSIHA